MATTGKRKRAASSSTISLGNSDGTEGGPCCGSASLNVTSADILAYQAPYLKVKVKELQRNNEELELQRLRTDEQQKETTNALQVIKRHWTSLVDSLQLLLMRVEAPGSLPQPSAKLSGSSLSGNQASLSLLQQLVNSDHAQAGIKPNFSEEYLDKQLEEKTKSSMNIVLKLVQSVEAQRNHNEELSAMLRFDKDDDAVQSALVEENERLRKELAKSENVMNTLHVQVKELQNDKERLGDELLVLNERAGKWKKERDEGNAKYQACMTKLDQMELVPNISLGNSAKRARLDLSSSNSSLSSSSGLLGSGKMDMSNGPVDEKKDPERNDRASLDLELQEAKRLADARLVEINDLAEKNAQLLKSSEKLRHSLDDVPVDVIIQSPVFKEEQRAREYYYKLYSECMNETKRLRQDLSNAQRELDIHRLEVEDRLCRRHEEFVKVCAEKDTMIGQLRSERDALAYKLEAKMMQPSAEELTQELKKLTESQALYLMKLKRKLEKGGGAISEGEADDLGGLLGSQSSTQSSSASQDPASLSGGSAKYLQLEEEWKRKEKKWTETQKDMQLLIDTYKIASKDRRDVVQIRKNEKKLQDECAELEGKVKELENSLEKFKKITELDINSPNPIAEKTLQEKLSVEKKLQDAETKVQEMQKQIDSLKEESSALLVEIDEISTAFEDMMSQNERLLRQVEEQHDARTQLVKERLRAKKLQQRMQEENSLLNEKIARLGEKVEAQSQLLKATESQLRNVHEANNRIQNESRVTQFAYDAAKKQWKEEHQRAEEATLKVQSLQSNLEESRKDALESKVKLEEVQLKLNRKEEESGSLKLRVDRLNASQNRPDVILEEELKTLKKSVQCSVCRDRRIGCVVTLCGHVFCQECVQLAMSNRRRNCPGCGTRFGASDVKPLFLSFE